MKHDSSNAILESVNQLVSAVTSLVSAVGSAAANAAEGAAHRASAAAQAIRGRASGAVAGRSAKLKQAIKAHWDSMTPAQRKARIKKMLAARGLKPKVK